MITNLGQKIIAKYLIGQAPAFASYIAVGCGPAPLASVNDLSNYATKTSLTFETHRMPIISRGYIVDNNQAKIVLTAELPSEERYEITEIGLYPAMTNNLAVNTDSKMLFKMGTAENWTKNGTDVIVQISDRLSTTISSTTNISPIFRANSDNAGLDTIYRIENYQRPRFQNEKIFVSANSTDSLFLSGLTLDLSESSPNDEITIAFSVLDNDEASTKDPDSITVTLKFKDANSKYASASFVATNGQGGVDFGTNRYFVISRKIKDFTIDADFDFRAISQAQIEIGATVTSPAAKSDFYVAIDAIRLENRTSVNPLYGLVAYSPIVNVDADDNPVTIVKQPNTSNLIEFRFNVGI